MAFVLSLACITAAFYIVWQVLELQRKEILQLKMQLNTRLTTLQHTTQKQQHQMQSTLHTLHDQMQLLQNPVHDISTTWLMLKAQYAIELAQLNAYWGTNKATTLTMLEQADQFLAQSSESKLFPVRQALSQDLSTQRMAPSLDEIGLLSQLDALQKLVMHYALNHNLSSTPTLSTTDFQTNLNFIKQFFIIRYRPDPLEPLLTPAYKLMQRETIRISLQEAQWAVLQHNDAVYHFALNQANQYVEFTFGAGSPETLQIVQQLQPLQAISVQLNPIIPEHALDLLQQLETQP
jgi:uroporphyrin-3 C-methyltransferase